MPEVNKTSPSPSGTHLGGISKGSAPPDVPAPPIPPTFADREKPVVDLHLYEYQALTTRITYLITMQYALWPVGVAALAYLTSLWNVQNHFFLELVGVLVGETLSVAFYFTSCEICTHVCYLEVALKPMVARDCNLDETTFWAWERWLSGFKGGFHRGKFHWWELWPLLLVALVILAIGFIHLPCWPCGEWYVFILALVGLVPLVWLDIKVNRIREAYRQSPYPAGKTG